MTEIEKLAKYALQNADWTEKGMDYVEMKIKAQTIVGLFVALRNTLAPHVTPDLFEKVNDLEDELLEYIDETFLDSKPTKQHG
jgi:hypothetical protein